MSDLERAWAFVHAQECGGRCRVVNDPADPGGATAHGIARNANPAAWEHGPPTVEQARELFRELYWQPAGCETMAWPLSLAVADFAFHSGVAKAYRTLMRIGHVDDPDTALRLIEARRAFLRSLATFERFGRGWMARCDRLEAEVRA